MVIQKRTTLNKTFTWQWTQLNLITFKPKEILVQAKKNNPHVSGNAGGEKNLHPGDAKGKIINLIEFFK